MIDKKLLTASYILYIIAGICMLSALGGYLLVDTSLDNAKSILGIGWMFYFLGLCSGLLHWRKPDDH